MKLGIMRPIRKAPGSHPSRGAWIEIYSKATNASGVVGRTPRGVRGLKSEEHKNSPRSKAVAPLAGCVD